jgi:hypothetical protein
MSNDPVNRVSPRSTFWMWAVIIGLIALLIGWLAQFGLP